jgi:hypothetical protein
LTKIAVRRLFHPTGEAGQNAFDQGARVQTFDVRYALLNELECRVRSHRGMLPFGQCEQPVNQRRGKQAAFLGTSPSLNDPWPILLSIVPRQAIESVRQGPLDRNDQFRHDPGLNALLLYVEMAQHIVEKNRCFRL